VTWTKNEDPDFVVPHISSFPVGEGEDRDEWVCCDYPGCPEMWGIHGSGDFDEHLRSEGWNVLNGQHLCVEHAWAWASSWG
jgi:hypothetical protein